MAQTNYQPTEDSRSMANDVLRRVGALTLRAGSAPGTAAAPPQSESARPSFVNDEAAIERGHRERRVLLAKRRAEQQVELTIEAWLRLGHVVTPAQARMLAGIAVAAYTDTLAHARR